MRKKIVASSFDFSVRNSTYIKAFRLYSSGDKKKIAVVILVQSLLGFVDLIGVAFIGMVGALSFSAVSGSASFSSISTILRLLHLDGIKVQNQIVILSFIALIIFVVKTFFSIYFTRRILFFLSAKGAIASNKVIQELLNQNILFLQNRTSQDYLYSVTQGIQSITLGVVGASISMVADLSATFVLLFGIGFVDWRTAIGATVYFGLMGYALYFFMHKKADQLGEQSAELQIRSSNKILEVLQTHREALIRGRIDFYVKLIGEDRLKLSKASAEMFFMPNISKYVIETGVIVGAVIISFSQFLLGNSSHAVITLAVFMAAGIRIAPAVLRIQQGVIGIRTSLGSARPTMELIDSLNLVSEKTVDFIPNQNLKRSDFRPEIEVQNITFSYPSAAKKALDDISFSVPRGTVLAIVGESGSGKSTLVDSLLGVIKPDAGQITISGYSPLTSVKIWPGSVAYVPQNVVISQGTIKANLALGFDQAMFSEEEYGHALEIAQLNDFVNSLPNKMHTIVGENGAKLSGGQRQRLGIARALMTEPSLIVLDEATSSLDSATENSLSEAILKLRGSVTLVIVAHRLSTIRSADSVLYLSSGKKLAFGTFEQVRKTIPEFDAQANLLGIN
jgi:ABC-type multidrug transport system fused ATPase/permease subunit